VYQAVPVERRDIVVTAQAAGAINPDTIVQVKSKASGEILDMKVQTGDMVRRGTLMVQVDQRIPTNDVATARAVLQVDSAQLLNARAKLHRADELFAAKAITQEEHEAAALAVAVASASVIRDNISYENAKIALGDTQVLAPINGMVIQQNVQRGTVISSPNTASGGTVLLTMADLSLVQVKTYVDETDIGKLHPGMPAEVTVAAFPSRPFRGEVAKIEPQGDTIQNVTMFPVLINIDNKDGLLKPGMNAEVRMQVGERKGVLAVPNAALRTEKDVASAATVLGIAPDDLKRMLEEAKKVQATTQAQAADTGTAAKELAAPNGGGAMRGGDSTARRGGGQGQGGGRNGGAAGQAGGAGGNGTGGNGGGRGGRGGGRGGRGASTTDYLFGGKYIVFAQREGKPVPVYVQTGLTDLDWSEVKSGLTEKDSVLMLPSASFVQAQQDLQKRMKATSGGLPGQATPAATPGAGGGGGGRQGGGGPTGGGGGGGGGGRQGGR
jgi:HlyD family secretion protein